MDKLKNLINKSSSSSSSSTATPQGNAAPAGQKEDYGDKALDAIEKKFGIHQTREQNEAYTDKARALYEKQTGKKVSEKFSN